MTFTKRFVSGVAFVSVAVWASQAHAQLGVGTWVRTDAHANGITMTVEACCSGGLRLIYHLPGAAGQPPVSLSVDSPMDGTEVPAMMGGKPSGQTMAIKRVDDRHYTAALKMGGQPFGTSNATLSADGKTMTVETLSQMSATAEKVIETWVRK
jgi:hypothetical protein